MASNYEHLPIDLGENISTAIYPLVDLSTCHRSFQDQSRGFDWPTPQSERLSQPLATPAAYLLPTNRQLSEEQRSRPANSIARKPVPERMEDRDPLASGFWATLNGWWWWEIASISLSLASLVAVVVLLAKTHDRPLSSWNFPIALNAIISIFLYDIEGQPDLFGRCLYQSNKVASRGPLGAVKLLFTACKGRSWPSGAAAMGSVITIAAVALDPFAQQIISFPLKETSLDLGSSSINITNIYDSGNPGGITDSMSKNVAVTMQGAIMNGMYSLDSPVKFDCETSNCTWPTFYTLGVCSSCTDVTSLANVSCEHDAGRKTCIYKLPKYFELWASSWSSSGGGGQTSINSTGTNYADRLDGTSPLAYIGLVKISKGGLGDELLTSGTLENPTAFECAFKWCVKAYHNVSASKGIIDTANVEEFDLSFASQILHVDGKDYRTLTLFGTAPDVREKNFTINNNDHETMSEFLATFFTTSDQEMAARALFMSDSIPETLSNIATSMTNNIREGVNATHFPGTSTKTETYIQVSWPWMILPSMVVLLGAALLVACVLMSSSNGLSLWKSSSLGLLFCRIEGWELSTVITNSPAILQTKAKRMRGRLEDDKRHIRVSRAQQNCLR
ncbi:hypothetical protein VTL71DRAFT_8321 [Oculimacula yallundae]|uniref:Uncharacterized protein n=1 Tax=Oculimacula yallundae TaxID=86028 RepID=A0ABR4CYT0_9HELO